MTTDKPKVLAYHVNKENPEHRGVTLEPLILLSDYEALQAECEKLRKLVAECADYLDTNDMTSIGHGSILHRKLIDAGCRETANEG